VEKLKGALNSKMGEDYNNWTSEGPKRGISYVSSKAIRTEFE